MVTANKPPAGTTAKPKEKASLTEYAYEQLKDRILALHFLPGQYLNEASLSEQLEIGRTPIHQALQRLKEEGLVEILPRKGIIVQPDSLGEIVNILDSRLTVEPQLAQFAAQRVSEGKVTEAEIAEMKELADATPEETQPPDIALFSSNDRKFHVAVATLSGNPVMAGFARKLHERSSRFWYLNMWQTIDVAASNTQHLDIAEAIAQGDESGANEKMHAHILSLRKRLKQLEALAGVHGRFPAQ